MEGWPSGRRRATRNRLGGDEPSRGFKSHSLRHIINTENGEVAEWSKAGAWRASGRQRPVGSNPSFSARHSARPCYYWGLAFSIFQGPCSPVDPGGIFLPVNSEMKGGKRCSPSKKKNKLLYLIFDTWFFEKARKDRFFRASEQTYHYRFAAGSRFCKALQGRLR